MARSKPKATVVASEQQAVTVMLELAGLARDVKRIEIDAQENIDLIKENAAQELEPLQQRRKELEAALCTFATLNKAELFKGSKSRETPFGIYGWRKSTKLLTLPKIKLGDVLERLRELNIMEAIRRKEDVDKTVLAGWTDSKLESVGMRRTVNDVFYIDVKDVEEVD